MKKVSIKYNPYQITTEIKVDGQTPKANSALNVAGFRLQEWVERLPQILMDEYRDSNFEVNFTGTETDYNDVLASFKSFGNKVNASTIWSIWSTLYPSKLYSSAIFLIYSKPAGYC